MSFKDIFWNSGTKETQPPPSKVFTSKAYNPIDNVNPNQVYSNSNQRPGEPDQKMLSHFDETLREANIQGPDYYELMVAVAEMDYIPDETSKLKAAFAMLKAQGVTKEKLLSTAKQYLEILSKEYDDFNASAKQKEQKEVGQSRDKITLLENRNEEITRELLSNKSEISELKEKVQNAGSTIALTTTAFKNTYNFVVTQIQNHIESITKFIN